jgi:hypothetical protein
MIEFVTENFKALAAGAASIGTLIGLWLYRRRGERIRSLKIELSKEKENAGNLVEENALEAQDNRVLKAGLERVAADARLRDALERGRKGGE